MMRMIRYFYCIEFNTNVTVSILFEIKCTFKATKNILFDISYLIMTQPKFLIQLHEIFKKIKD